MGWAKARFGKILIAIVVACIAGFTVAHFWLSSSGPPAAPGGIRAKEALCLPPHCPVLSSEVSVSWSRPGPGSSVTGYDVYRDGKAISKAPLAASATSFTDHDAGFGLTRTYQVKALSKNGDSPLSVPASAKIPLPPDRFAQLSGIYTVHLTVRSATNISKADGITNPATGDTYKQTWNIEPSCPTDTGPCPVTLPFKFVGVAMHPAGRSYVGGGHSTTASCPGNDVPVYYTFHLQPTKAAMVDAHWVYTGFNGMYGLAFSCPNTGNPGVTFTLVAKL
jgi:hypothetical protein